MNKKTGGFTLIEVIVSFFLIFISILIYTTAFSNSAKVNTESYEINQGTFIAQKKLEQVKSSVRTGDDFTALDSTPYTRSTENPDYIYRIDVQEKSESVKYVGVFIYDRKSGAKNTDPAADAAGEQIMSLGTYILKP